MLPSDVKVLASLHHASLLAVPEPPTPEPVLGAYTSPNAAANQVWGQVLPSIASSAANMFTAAFSP